MATLAGGNDPVGSKDKWQTFCNGLSIETIVNVAKKGIGPENITPVCCSSSKIELI